MNLHTDSALAKAGAVICIAALAAACLTLVPDPPADPVLGALGDSLRQALSTPVQSVFLLGLLGGLVLLGGLIVAIVRQYLTGARLDWWSFLQRRLANTLLGYGLLTLMALALHSLKPADKPVPVQAESAAVAPVKPGGVAPSPLPPPPSPPSPSPWPWFVAGAALLAGTGLLVVTMRGRKVRTAAATVPEEAVLVAAARRRLESGDEVRDAIVGCYAEMCSVFSRRGPERTQSLTAREFAALLRARGAGEPEILALTSVFEKARYSIDPCDERDRSQAVEALRVIESRYGRPEPAPSDGVPS